MFDKNDVPIFSLHHGRVPLLVSIPHLGTRIPAEIAATMTDVAPRIDDCDWHLDRLYSFAIKMGASIITPSFARYVIDLNRPPDNQNLYPGQDTTELVPINTFDKELLYRPGHLPSHAEIISRRELYWRPYHDALVAELAALKKAHGVVLLWDAHSIRSRVPRLFDGLLPDFNFGTAGGASALDGLAEELAKLVEHYSGYSDVSPVLSSARI
jgi:N-formylglutamate deformylase